MSTLRYGLLGVCISISMLCGQEGRVERPRAVGVNAVKPPKSFILLKTALMSVSCYALWSSNKIARAGGCGGLLLSLGSLYRHDCSSVKRFGGTCLGGCALGFFGAYMLKRLGRGRYARGVCVLPLLMGMMPRSWWRLNAKPARENKNLELWSGLAGYIDKNGSTPLHYAAAHGWYQKVKFLLDSGTLVDKPVQELYAALKLAAFNGYAGTFGLLLSRVDLRDREAIGAACLGDLDRYLAQDDICAYQKAHPQQEDVLRMQAFREALFVYVQAHIHVFDLYGNADFSLASGLMSRAELKIV